MGAGATRQAEWHDSFVLSYTRSDGGGQSTIIIVVSKGCALKSGLPGMCVGQATGRQKTPIDSPIQSRDHNYSTVM